MNITDVNVSPGILSSQSFPSLGRIKLEASLNYSSGQNKDLNKNMSKGDRLF